ncbi:Crp/Fnr family transcriptional regulator [Ferrovibrio sp.]|uniref:Crp/Fnr family transcriptional regulator n=1 Tax=Ferrovibrio sp. TaxID=1917215 RepID=UPI003D0A4C01
MTSSPYQIKDFAKGEMLFRAGDAVPDEAAEAFLVLEGRLEVYLDGADGEPLPLGSIEPGQIVGEMALLDGQPRSAHVGAGPKGARCAVITRSVLQRLVGEADPVLRGLLNAYAKRLRSANKQHAAAAESAVELSGLNEPERPRGGPALVGVTNKAQIAALLSKAARDAGCELTLYPNGSKAWPALQAGAKPAIVVAVATGSEDDGPALAKLIALKLPKPRPGFVLIGRADGKPVSFNPKEVDDLVDQPVEITVLADVIKARLRNPPRS